MGIEVELTTENLKTLGKTLAIKYKDHPDFPEAIHLIATLLTLKGESTEEIVGRN